MQSSACPLHVAFRPKRWCQVRACVCVCESRRCLSDAPDLFRRNQRRCPRCGDVVLTLGDTCPSCGKPFERRVAADRIPDRDWLIDTPWGAATLGLILSVVVFVGIVFLNRI
jgi:hypothetical protein